MKNPGCCSVRPRRKRKWQPVTNRSPIWRGYIQRYHIDHRIDYDPISKTFYPTILPKYPYIWHHILMVTKGRHQGKIGFIGGYSQRGQRVRWQVVFEDTAARTRTAYLTDDMFEVVGDTPEEGI